MPDAPFSLLELSELTGSQRVSIKKWLKEEPCETLPQALAMIQERQRKGKRENAEVDPETGLSWFQASLREKTIRERRENEISELKRAGELIDTHEALQIISLLCNKLDGLPSKMKSECGLNEDQRLRLQRAVDDIRSDAAKAIVCREHLKESLPESPE